MTEDNQKVVIISSLTAFIVLTIFVTILHKNEAKVRIAELEANTSCHEVQIGETQ